MLAAAPRSSCCHLLGQRRARYRLIAAFGNEFADQAADAGGRRSPYPTSARQSAVHAVCRNFSYLLSRF